MAAEYRRIVFLDIDGVLANFAFLRTGRGYINPKCIKSLNRLGEIGTEIVISSSWGYDNGRTEKSLRDCGLTLPIIGYTEHFESGWLCRGNEIEKWLVNTFGDTVDYEYVILDDVPDILLKQKQNFIQVDEEIGLTNKNINKVIKILTRHE